MVQPLQVGCLTQKTAIEGSPLDIDRLSSALHDYTLDFLIAPEYAFSSGILTAEEKDSRLGHLCRATKDSSAVIIPGTGLWTDGHCLYNTTYVVTQGMVVASYDKVNYSAEESELAGEAGKQFGYRLFPRIIEAGGISLGIEICIEHKYKTLYLEKQTPDVHVLLSRGISFVRRANLNASILAILCDGSSPRSEVLQREGSGWKELYPRAEDGLVIFENPAFSHV